MQNFQKHKLGSLYTVFSGLSKSRDEFGFGYPFVTFKDVFYNFFLPEELGSLANTNDKERKSCSVKKGDIFLTRTSETMSELGMSAVALKDYENATFNGFTKRLRLKDNVSVQVDPVFMGYYMRTSHIRNQIGMHASMTTRASLNSEAINSIEIEIPEIDVQVRIGEILKSLDDKIELNRQMNQTLEQMAQTLFKKYFVDDIDEDNLPEGWKVGTLGEVSKNIRKSISPKDFTNDQNYVGLEHLPRKSLALYEFDNSSKVGSQKAKFEENDILFGKLRPYFHKIVLAPFEGICSTDILVIKPKSEVWLSFCLFHFYSDEIIDYSNKYSDGTRMPRVNWENLSSYQIAIPPIGLANNFNEEIKPYLEKIKNNIQEIKTLTQLRDTLLPKLMSGEIDVNQVASPKAYEEVLS
jgi:type I restriction enzyme S subunit